MTTLSTQSDPWLAAGELARFAPGLTWSTILAAGHHSRHWWRAAVVEAESRGLLEYDPKRGVWRLTTKGREHVRDVS